MVAAQLKDRRFHGSARLQTSQPAIIDGLLFSCGMAYDIAVRIGKFCMPFIYALGQISAISSATSTP